MHAVIVAVVLLASLCVANEFHPVGSRQCMADENIQQELIKMKCEEAHLIFPNIELWIATS